MISVVVSTYNRSDSLARVLQSLCDQTLQKSRYEIILVDNNSTDDTRSVTESFAERYENVRYCLETKQGLAHARNRGWRESHGDYVAFVDDDAKAPSHFLQTAEGIIERMSPLIFGGSFYAFYDSPRPSWYKDSYGSHEPFKEARILDHSECVVIYGTNMFFRREAIDSVGGFDVALGMSGRKMAYGEDTALVKSISAAMPEGIIYYDPKLYVYHLVAPEKMTLRWIVRSRLALGRTTYTLFHNDNASPETRSRLFKCAAGVLLRLAADLVYGSFTRDRKRYPHFQNYFYEQTAGYVEQLGSLGERYRQLTA